MAAVGGATRGTATVGGAAAGAAAGGPAALEPPAGGGEEWLTWGRKALPSWVFTILKPKKEKKGGGRGGGGGGGGQMKGHGKLMALSAY